MYIKVSTKDRKPPEGVPVITIDKKGNAQTHKWFNESDKMPEGEKGIPVDDSQVEFWLEKIDKIKVSRKDVVLQFQKYFRLQNMTLNKRDNMLIDFITKLIESIKLD